MFRIVLPRGPEARGLTQALTLWWLVTSHQPRAARIAQEIMPDVRRIVELIEEDPDAVLEDNGARLHRGSGSHRLLVKPSSPLVDGEKAGPPRRL